jgi:hypothetical protein
MKARYTLGVAMIALALAGANSLISEHAALVSGALDKLKFESVPGKPDLIGAPPKMRVTKKTIDYLQKLMKEGKTIEVGNDGSIEILDKAK